MASKFLLLTQKYVAAGLYEGNVHKLSALSTFLPVTFDEFGSFRITGTYQATILEYRFGCEEEAEQEYSSFEHYLSAATQGCICCDIQSDPTSSSTSSPTTAVVSSSS